MEPARSTDKFSRRITSADANNIVTILDLNIVNAEYQIFAEDYICKFQVAVEDIKATVGLFSLTAAPFPNTNALQSDAQQQTEIAKVQTNGQKIALGLYTAKANGPWEYQSRIVLQNQGGDETHVPILVPFLSTNEVLLVGGDFKLGAKIEPIWNQPLKAQDYLVIHGTYKQVVSFSKKKDDSLEALSDRISALESLISVFGAPSATLPGSNGLVPAPPAGGGEYLMRGDRAWQDPDEFVDKQSAEEVGGAKSFSGILTALKEMVVRGVGSLAGYSSRTAATLFSTGGGAYLSLTCAAASANSRSADLGLDSTGTISLRRINDAYTSVVGNVFQTDTANNLRLFGFTTLGDNIALRAKILTGTTAAAQGQFVQISHGLDGSKITATILSVSFSANQWVTANYNLSAGYECSCQHTNAAITVGCVPGNSANILSKPFTVLIFYTN